MNPGSVDEIQCHKDGADPRNLDADSKSSFLTVVATIHDPNGLQIDREPGAVLEYSTHKTGLIKDREGKRTSPKSHKKLTIEHNSVYLFPGGLIQHRVKKRGETKTTRYTVIMFYKIERDELEKHDAAFRGNTKTSSRKRKRPRRKQANRKRQR